MHGSIFVAFQQLLLRLYLSILTTDWDIWISMCIYIDIYLGMISKISIFSLSAFQCMDMIKRIKSHFNLTTKAIRPHLKAYHEIDIKWPHLYIIYNCRWKISWGLVKSPQSCTWYSSALSNFCHPHTIEHCETMAILSLCTKKTPTVSILILSFWKKTHFFLAS